MNHDKVYVIKYDSNEGNAVHVICNTVYTVHCTMYNCTVYTIQYTIYIWGPYT